MYFDLKEFQNEDNKTCVDYTHYFKLHFIKTIPFISGKLAWAALEECKENWQERFPIWIWEELALPGIKSSQSIPLWASEIP